MPDLSPAARPRKMPNQLELAIDDLKRALSLTWFWGALGWQDIVQKYRGSMLGPFWLTITTGIFIAGLGPLYARLFSLDMSKYLPYMALGVTTWGFITGTINDCCNAFLSASHVMKQMKVPRLAIIFQVIWRSIIVFIHNLPIYIVIFLWFKIPLTWGTILVIPGFTIVCLNLIWIGIVVSILCARFRDITPIIGSVLQIGFFVTPVMWSYKLQSVSPWIVNINPFAAMIELIRAPLLGEMISVPLFVLALACLPVGYTVAAALFVRARRQIVFWV